MSREAVLAQEVQECDAAAERRPVLTAARQGVRLEIFGEEILEKCVRVANSSGRVYLPRGWVGHRVKIIRID